MRLIALKPFNHKAFYKNAIFDERSWTGSSPYLIAARKLLAQKNIILNTIDIASNSPTQKDIYMDVPYPWELQLWVRILRNKKKSILFIVEPPIVNPFNHMGIFHFFFSKVYSWNDGIIDNVKYFKYYLPVITDFIRTDRIPFKEKKLLIMMNMNWLPFLPFKLLSFSKKELYTERIKALEFFDTYYPSDFCLYGKGWNKPQRFSIKQKIFGYKKYKTHQGEFLSKDKHKILSRFKFCLCFENCEIAGNISEKIFDSFKARCVPVYLGAPNIEDYISSKCFIDFRKFKNYQELVEFLNSIDEETYNGYLKEIEEFLKSKEFQKQWSIDTFAKVFLKTVAQ